MYVLPLWQVLSKFRGLGKVEKLPREVLSPNIQKEILYADNINTIWENRGSKRDYIHNKEQYNIVHLREVIRVRLMSF